MAEYRIEFTKRADRQLRKLSRGAQKRVARVIEEVRLDPRREGAVKLRGNDDLWRVRTGAYRVIYAIEDDCLVVLVVTLGHRREIYRDN